MSNPSEPSQNNQPDNAARNILNPGKGVDYYAFVDPTLNAEVTFSQPINGGSSTQSYTVSSANDVQGGNLQITQADIGLAVSGRFLWTAYDKGKGSSLASHYADIEPTIGNLWGSDMENMLETPSITTPGYDISYGFYDSGSGASGLTNQDQAYVYLTPSRATWMGELVKQMGSSLAAKPFHVWALPGAHDAGTFDTTVLNTLLTSAKFIGYLTNVFFVPVGALLSTGPALLQRGIINMAVTQKDNIATMLDLGVRYFDFRPGYMVSSDLSPGIYHQHLVVPGYAYSDFLNDIVYWLTSNDSEIVVVSSNFQGFLSGSMQPSPDVLNAALQQALVDQAPGGTIVPGDKTDLNSSYATLIKEKKRLIFLNQIGAPNDASKYDSYSAEAYETTEVATILNALNSMTAAGQAAHDYTVLQLQGTATGLKSVIAAAFGTLSDASSPLLSTKAMFDGPTYLTALNLAQYVLQPTQLLVLLNDFCDNALATYAMRMTEARARAVKQDLASGVAAKA
jgi:hypothetical protein